VQSDGGQPSTATQPRKGGESIAFPRPDGIGIARSRRRVAFSADLVDPGRVNIFGRWESQEALESFRGSAPSNEQGAAMLSVSVAEYDIADERPVFGKEAE
jgi:hypothetical protein